MTEATGNDPHPQEPARRGLVEALRHSLDTLHAAQSWLVELRNLSPVEFGGVDDISEIYSATENSLRYLRAAHTRAVEWFSTQGGAAVSGARTTLPPERVAEVLAAGRAEATKSEFVDPDMVARALRVLAMRGEGWAASVLLRSLERRSVSNPRVPWFQAGEMETLILADVAEFRQLFDAEPYGDAPK